MFFVSTIAYHWKQKHRFCRDQQTKSFQVYLPNELIIHWKVCDKFHLKETDHWLNCFYMFVSVGVIVVNQFMSVKKTSRKNTLKKWQGVFFSKKTFTIIFSEKTCFHPKCFWKFHKIIVSNVLFKNSETSQKKSKSVLVCCIFKLKSNWLLLLLTFLHEKSHNVGFFCINCFVLWTFPT